MSCHSKRASISYVFSPVFGVQLLKTIIKKTLKKTLQELIKQRVQVWSLKLILRHDPFTHDHTTQWGVIEISYQEKHIFRP